MGKDENEKTTQELTDEQLLEGAAGGTVPSGEDTITKLTSITGAPPTGAPPTGAPPTGG